jgi:site-specific recombinase XerC
MSNSTTVVANPATSPTFVDLPTDAQERIRHYQAAAQGQNTSRAYGAQLRLFKAWCARQGYSDMPPVPPAVVAQWIVERADAGASRSTLGVALAAIKFGHRIAGERFEAADPHFIQTLAGARREAVQEQRQAAPLRPAVLGEVLKEFGARDDDLSRRDAAMLAILYMLALRRSELVEIDFEERGDGLAVLRLSDEGLELELLRSKGDQEKPVKVAVPRSCNPRGFAALERWIAHADINPGTPLFRRIWPRGGIGGRITPDGANRAIKAALARYHRTTGADHATAARLAARYSGHSGRVGFVVASKEAGASDTDVASTTRHRSLEMIRRYGATADQHRRAPHRLPGVGL